MMTGLRTLPSGSLLGGVQGEQTIGLKWLSSSEMLSLLSGLMDRSGLCKGVKEFRELIARRLSDVRTGAEKDRLFSVDNRTPVTAAKLLVMGGTGT